MYVSDIGSSAAQGQAGLWLLAVFLLGLSIMAWLTFREASLYETKTGLKNLRRSRRSKSTIPAQEQISFFAHCSLFFRSVMRGGQITAPFTEVIGEGEYDFEFRLRNEIDKITGKSVYHGQKEQL